MELNRAFGIFSSVVSRIILISIIIVYVIVEWIAISSFSYIYHDSLDYGPTKTISFFMLLLHTIFSPGAIPAAASSIFLIKKAGKPLWFSIIIAVVYFLEFLGSYITIPFFIMWAFVQCVWAVVLFIIYKNVVCRNDGVTENGENQTPVDHD